MKIVPAEGFGVIATMKHSCGHDVDMFYAAEEFVRGDEENQRNRLCVYCDLELIVGI